MRFARLGGGPAGLFRRMTTAVSILRRGTTTSSSHPATELPGRRLRPRYCPTMPWRNVPVIGAPNDERGMIVEAHVVPGADETPSGDLIKRLQDQVKETIAPVKHPRSVVFTEALPNTESGKIQRFKSRETGT